LERPAPGGKNEGTNGEELRVCSLRYGGGKEAGKKRERCGVQDLKQEVFEGLDDPFSSRSEHALKNLDILKSE